MDSPPPTPSRAGGGGLLIGGSDGTATQTVPSPRAHPAHRRVSRAARPSNTFRGDVAGLRAVAVGLVLLYHSGLPYITGGFIGVDVFFVISGFLITGQLVAEIDRTGGISLAGFYARRAKRILPAAGVVLVVTAAAAWLLVPGDALEEIAVDIVSAALYVVNWRLAENSVDYMAQDAEPSPVQHYWSLAVEEQFYIVWPLLIIAAIVVARAIGRRNVRPILWFGLGLVAVPSFVWSVLHTATTPERAFFVSTTRMWELAIGAGLALLATSVARIPRSVAIVVGWLGLAAIASSAFLVTAQTPWPGYAAAVPTLGAAAVIAAGAAAGPGGPVAILGTRPFRWVGDLSYSLYLWHWPMIVLATAYWTRMSLVQSVAVVAASVIPAWITYRLVESPLRYSRAMSGSPRLALGVGGLFTMAGMVVGIALLVATVGPAATPADATGRDAPGAGVLLDLPGYRLDGPVPERFDFITPDPKRATKDLPNKSACFQSVSTGSAVKWCSFGNPKGTKVALVGDSKMYQWLPAFLALAEQNDWNLVAAFKGSCPFTSADAIEGESRNTLCTEWNAALLRRLVSERPQYVITSHVGSQAMDASGQVSSGAMVAGMRASWSTLVSAGATVIVFANNPWPGFHVYRCVDRNRDRLSECAFDPRRHDEDAAYVVQREAVAGQSGVKMIDLFAAICPTNPCPPVIGNVLIYRGGSHVTATYVKTMTPHIAQALSGVGMQVRLTGR